ncbi:hypothetical protein Cadr_000007571 [Camelus dromedarius]|uniref:Uncharacterized protein n=1 Tax=Camelus dromedarius TaxID=9838 RepID=A0A5N4E7X2_CAMDR|nr:hypothetical protein Cadr_000007571 [Camelus dromedarius]
MFVGSPLQTCPLLSAEEKAVQLPCQPLGRGNNGVLWFHWLSSEPNDDKDHPWGTEPCPRSMPLIVPGPDSSPLVPAARKSAPHREQPRVSRPAGAPLFVSWASYEQRSPAVPRALPRLGGQWVPVGGFSTRTASCSHMNNNDSRLSDSLVLGRLRTSVLQSEYGMGGLGDAGRGRPPRGFPGTEMLYVTNAAVVTRPYTAVTRLTALQAAGGSFKPAGEFTASCFSQVHDVKEQLGTLGIITAGMMASPATFALSELDCLTLSVDPTPGLPPPLAGLRGRDGSCVHRLTLMQTQPLVSLQLLCHPAGKVEGRTPHVCAVASKTWNGSKSSTTVEERCCQPRGGRPGADSDLRCGAGTDEGGCPGKQEMGVASRDREPRCLLDSQVWRPLNAPGALAVLGSPAPLCTLSYTPPCPLQGLSSRSHFDKRSSLYCDGELSHHRCPLLSAIHPLGIEGTSEAPLMIPVCLVGPRGSEGQCFTEEIQEWLFSEFILNDVNTRPVLHRTLGTEGKADLKTTVCACSPCPPGTRGPGGKPGEEEVFAVCGKSKLLTPACGEGKRRVRAFRFLAVWGPRACAQPEFPSKNSETCIRWLCTPLWEGPGPCSSPHDFRDCLNLPFGTQGRSRRLKPFSYKQEMGRRKGFCTWEGPTGLPGGVRGGDTHCLVFSVTLAAETSERNGKQARSVVSGEGHKGLKQHDNAGRGADTMLTRAGDHRSLCWCEFLTRTQGLKHQHGARDMLWSWVPAVEGRRGLTGRSLESACSQEGARLPLTTLVPSRWALEEQSISTDRTEQRETPGRVHPGEEAGDPGKCLFITLGKGSSLNSPRVSFQERRQGSAGDGWEEDGTRYGGTVYREVLRRTPRREPGSWHLDIESQSQRRDGRGALVTEEGLQATESRQAVGAGTGKERLLFYSFQKERSSADVLTLAQHSGCNARPSVQLARVLRGPAYPSMPGALGVQLCLWPGWALHPHPVQTGLCPDTACWPPEPSAPSKRVNRAGLAVGAAAGPGDPGEGAAEQGGCVYLEGSGRVFQTSFWKKQASLLPLLLRYQTHPAETLAFHWLSPCQERSFSSSCWVLLVVQGVRAPPSDKHVNYPTSMSQCVHDLWGQNPSALGWVGGCWLQGETALKTPSILSSNKASDRAQGERLIALWSWASCLPLMYALGAQALQALWVVDKGHHLDPGTRGPFVPGGRGLPKRELEGAVTPGAQAILLWGKSIPYPPFGEPSLSGTEGMVCSATEGSRQLEAQGTNCEASPPSNGIPVTLSATGLSCSQELIHAGARRKEQAEGKISKPDSVVAEFGDDREMEEQLKGTPKPQPGLDPVLLRQGWGHRCIPGVPGIPFPANSPDLPLGSLWLPTTPATVSALVLPTVTPPSAKEETDSVQPLQPPCCSALNRWLFRVFMESRGQSWPGGGKRLPLEGSQGDAESRLGKGKRKSLPPQTVKDGPAMTCEGHQASQLWNLPVSWAAQILPSPRDVIIGGKERG